MRVLVFQIVSQSLGDSNTLESNRCIPMSSFCRTNRTRATCTRGRLGTHSTWRVHLRAAVHICISFFLNLELLEVFRGDEHGDRL
jgi:hypothetical protein